MSDILPYPQMPAEPVADLSAIPWHDVPNLTRADVLAGVPFSQPYSIRTPAYDFRGRYVGNNLSIYQGFVGGGVPGDPSHPGGTYTEYVILWVDTVADRSAEVAAFQASGGGNLEIQDDPPPLFPASGNWLEGTEPTKEYLYSAVPADPWQWYPYDGHGGHTSPTLFDFSYRVQAIQWEDYFDSRPENWELYDYAHLIKYKILGYAFNFYVQNIFQPATERRVPSLLPVVLPLLTFPLLAMTAGAVVSSVVGNPPAGRRRKQT